MLRIRAHQLGIGARRFRVLPKLFLGAGHADQRLRRQRAIAARRLRRLHVQRDGLLQIAVGVFLHEAALVQLLRTLRDQANGHGQREQNGQHQSRSRHALLSGTNL